MFRGKVLLSSSGQKVNVLFYHEDGGINFLRKQWYLSFQVSRHYNPKDTNFHLNCRLFTSYFLNSNLRMNLSTRGNLFSDTLLLAQTCSLLTRGVIRRSQSYRVTVDLGWDCTDLINEIGCAECLEKVTFQTSR